MVKIIFKEILILEKNQNKTPAKQEYRFLIQPITNHLLISIYYKQILNFFMILLLVKWRENLTTNPQIYVQPHRQVGKNKSSFKIIY